MDSTHTSIQRESAHVRVVTEKDATFGLFFVIFAPLIGEWGLITDMKLILLVDCEKAVGWYSCLHLH